MTERIDWTANVEAFVREMPGLAYDPRRRPRKEGRWILRRRHRDEDVETMTVRAKVRRFLESSRAVMPDCRKPFRPNSWSMYEMMSALKDLRLVKECGGEA